MKSFRAALSLLIVTGCGAAAAPTPLRAEAPAPRAAPAVVAEPSPTSVPEPVVAPEAEPAALEIPTACSSPGGAVCTPPPSFVAEICKRTNVDLALILFGKATPWTRAYVARDMEAWYTGARLAAPAELRLYEEVIIVSDRTASTGGMQLGGGSYDVIRWDGKCVSVMADEVTHQKPPQAEVAPIVWRRLDEPTREALLARPRIKLAYERTRARCRDDHGAPSCTEATRTLSLQIADYVRGGGDVPEPKLVMW